MLIFRTVSDTVTKPSQKQSFLGVFIVKIGVNQLIPSQEKLGVIFIFFRCVLLVRFNGDRVGQRQQKKRVAFKRQLPLKYYKSVRFTLQEPMQYQRRQQQQHLPQGCCLWRVMAAFVANVSELPFTHLHITCPMPRKPIVQQIRGNL